MGNHLSIIRTPRLMQSAVRLLCLLMFSVGFVNANWELQWIDRFEGTGVDWNNWTAQIQADYNNEVQCYTDDDSSENRNYDVSNGTLKIIARRQTVSCVGLGGETRTWTSGRLNGKDKSEVRYGRVEARIRFHDLEGGTWPAFWMLENRIAENPFKGDNDTVNWPNPGAGEIDVWEWFSNQGGSYITNFFNTSNCGAEYRPTYTGGATDVQDFHVYAMEWTPDAVSFFTDGTEVKSYDLSNCSQYEEGMFVLLNVAIGGNLGGAVDSNLNLATMEVDYVAHCIAAETGGTVGCNESTPMVTDDDGDGIGNQIDECPNTSVNEVVDHVGCEQSLPVEPGTPTTAAPEPSLPESYVISLFSDSYTNIPNIDFDPYWGQATDSTIIQIEQNDTLKYENLNYQGTDFDANHQDVTGMESLHVDFWTSNASNVELYLISPGPVETAYALPITLNEWVSVDIPLSAFTNVDLEDTFQLKVVGDGTVYFDNLYFKAIGSSNDTDGDGIVDVLDACPNSIANESIDDTGCAITAPQDEAPILQLTLLQNGIEITEIDTTNGLVTASVVIENSNETDGYRYGWSNDRDLSFNGDGATVTFNPEDQETGSISVTVVVTDHAAPALSSEAEVTVSLVEGQSQAGGLFSIWMSFFALISLFCCRQRSSVAS